MFKSLSPRISGGGARQDSTSPIFAGGRKVRDKFLSILHEENEEVSDDSLDKSKRERHDSVLTGSKDTNS